MNKIELEKETLGLLNKVRAHVNERKLDISVLADVSILVACQTMISANHKAGRMDDVANQELIVMKRYLEVLVFEREEEVIKLLEEIFGYLNPEEKNLYKDWLMQVADKFSDKKGYGSLFLS